MGNKGLLCIMFFYSGWGKEFIWYYLGLTLSLVSFTFFEISSQGKCTFNFHPNKNIFDQQFLFLSNLLFSLIKKVLQYKMIQKTDSMLINNHRHNKTSVIKRLTDSTTGTTRMDRQILRVDRRVLRVDRRVLRVHREYYRWKDENCEWRNKNC